MFPALVIVLALIIAGGAYFLFFATHTLTASDVKAEMDRITKLNTSNDTAGYNKPARLVGTFDGRELEEVYMCFGDVCPANGGYYVRFKNIASEQECKNINGKPIIGYGWGPVYGGCEPTF